MGRAMARANEVPCRCDELDGLVDEVAGGWIVVELKMEEAATGNGWVGEGGS